MTLMLPKITHRLGFDELPNAAMLDSQHPHFPNFFIVLDLPGLF